MAFGGWIDGWIGGWTDIRATGWVHGRMNWLMRAGGQTVGWGSQVM